MKYDVITFGSAVMDVYMKSDEFKKISSGEFEGGAAMCEAYGGKIEVDEVVVTSGGAGTNNAVSFARKGFNVAVKCEMGTDLIGAMIKEELRREKVSLDLIVEEDDEETGMSSILVSSEGGRAAIVYRGASQMLTVEDMQWDGMEADWYVVSSLGGRMELVEALVQSAVDKGSKVVWNPGEKEYEVVKQYGDRGKTLLGKIEVLILNREEAAELTGIDFNAEEIWKSDQGVEGPKVVVITDGRKGGKVFYEGKARTYDAIKVEAVEETGAGDAFGSGFVAALMKGKTVDEAISWGSKQAARVVRFMGPKKGLLSLEEIEKVA